MKVYKITDQNMQTYDGFQWELNVPKETDGKGILCSQHFLHFYHHPLIAAILHPMLEFKNPRLFEAEADGIILNDKYRKGGCSKLTLIKEIDLPQFTRNQRIACSILFAQQINKREQWNTWATNWLNDTDRTCKSVQSIEFAESDYLLINHYDSNVNKLLKSLIYSSQSANIFYSSNYNAGASATSVYFAIEFNPDIFTLENIFTTINKALEY